jgi:hypothetical protein
MLKAALETAEAERDTALKAADKAAAERDAAIRAAEQVVARKLPENGVADKKSVANVAEVQKAAVEKYAARNVSEKEAFEKAAAVKSATRAEQGAPLKEALQKAEKVASDDAPTGRSSRSSREGPQPETPAKARSEDTKCLLSLGLISGLLDVRSAVLCVAYDGESAADVPRWRRTRMREDAATGDFALDKRSVEVRARRSFSVILLDDTRSDQPVLGRTAWLKPQAIAHEADIAFHYDGLRIGMITLCATRR